MPPFFALGIAAGLQCGSPGLAVLQVPDRRLLVGVRHSAADWASRVRTPRSSRTEVGEVCRLSFSHVQARRQSDPARRSTTTPLTVWQCRGAAKLRRASGF